MRSIVLLSLLTVASLAAGPLAAAPAPVEYRIAFPHPERHEAEITITFRDLEPGVLEIRMSRSSPGRYALHEFAKNVYREQATDAGGRPLPTVRADPHQWNVDHEGSVVFSYTLFGDRTDGTYSAIDRRHAHLNMPATFAWARGLEQRPIRVTFDLPDPDWRVSTQLFPTDDPTTFTAPDLQYFLDSPAEVSDHRVWEWQADGSSYRLALHHEGTDDEARAFVAASRRIVDELVAVFGETPEFDVGSYTFLADYLHDASGDGMEHRNSTVLTSSLSIADAAPRLLGTVAHEFVHAWNVERIRPRSLEPFDFERANMSGELWFGEGFTSYYDQLILVRAGIIGLDAFATSVGRDVDAVLTSPGVALRSPVEMSYRAPFVDAASWIDPVNDDNTYLSYYTYGAALGLGLDLLLRTRYDLTLDDYMRAVWQAHGKTEIPYELDDLQRILARVTGDRPWAQELFERSIHGTEPPDFAALMRAAGLLLRPARPERPWLGGSEPRFQDGALVLGPVLAGSPLEAAGLGRGDRLLAVGDLRLDGAAALDRLLGRHSPGDRLLLRVQRRGETGAKEVEVTLAADPALEVVTFERAGLEVTAEIEAFRRRWLEPRAVAGSELHRYCPRDRRAWPFAWEHCPLDGARLLLAPPAE